MMWCIYLVDACFCMRSNRANSRNKIKQTEMTLKTPSITTPIFGRVVFLPFGCDDALLCIAKPHTTHTNTETLSRFSECFFLAFISPPNKLITIMPLTSLRTVQGRLSSVHRRWQTGGRRSAGCADAAGQIPGGVLLAARRSARDCRTESGVPRLRRALGAGGRDSARVQGRPDVRHAEGMAR